MDQSLLAAPHGFSQRATSFIASWRQGIHRMPFSCSIPVFSRQTSVFRLKAGIEPHHHAQRSSPCSRSASVVSLQRRLGPQLGLVGRSRAGVHWSSTQHFSGLHLQARSLNAPDRYRSDGWDDPWRLRTTIPSGQTNHPSTRRTRKATVSTARCIRTGPEDQPSCSAHPGAHQNQIHNTKEQTPTRPQASQQTAEPGHPTLSGARQTQPIEEPFPLAPQHHAIASLETIGFEPMTLCLQSRCSTN